MYLLQLQHSVRMHGARTLCAILCFLSLQLCGWSQEVVPQTTEPVVPQQITPITPPDPVQQVFPRPSSPAIGVGDEGYLTIYGVAEFGVPDMNEHFMVNSSGEIWVPLLGKVAVAGMTLENAQAMIEKRLLNEGYLKEPHISLIIKDYINDRVLIVGEVNKPGAYSSRTAPRLFDLFNAAGGLTPRAGSTVKITHLDQPQERESIILSNDPAGAAKSDVWLRAGDTVEVSRAGIVYILGEVNRAGGFVMEKDKLTALEILAMASGPTHLASMSHVQLIRRTSSGLDSKIVNLKKIVDAKSPDLALQAEDILFVPSSTAKTLVQMGAPSLVNSAASLAIYRVP